MSLDAKLRVQMRTTMARPQNQLGTATVHVTHDHTEAMTLGDRVAVMRRLRLWFDPASCTCSTPTTAPT